MMVSLLCMIMISTRGPTTLMLRCQMRSLLGFQGRMKAPLDRVVLPFECFQASKNGHGIIDTGITGVRIVDFGVFKCILDLVSESWFKHVAARLGKESFG